MNNEEKKNTKVSDELEEDKTVEVTSEADDNAAENETSTKEPDALEAAQEIATLKDSLLRKAAEFENYRKRTLKEKTELLLNGSEKTVGAILPVLDDFERALADKTDDVQALRKGMELIYNKFVKTLEGLGVKKIETEGEDFNVDFHEAVAMVPGMGDDKKGKVIDCVQAGYKLNDKVIRHAKVAVGQ